MARSLARTVGGISYDAALSDGHQPQYGHDGARSPAAGFSHRAAAGGARRSVYFFAAEFRKNMPNAHASVRSATSRAAKTQKNYFDKHVKGPPFALNQLVWLYWPRPLLRIRSRKLTRSWTVPWRIVEFKTTIVVVVENVKTHKKQRVHVDRLVPCRGRFHDKAEETVVPPSTRPRRNPRRPARLQDYDLSE